MQSGLEREGLEVPSPLQLCPRQPGCRLATPGFQVMLAKVDGAGLEWHIGAVGSLGHCWGLTAARADQTRPDQSGRGRGVGERGGWGALTSMEQPSREPFCRAFWMILNRLAGAFLSSYHSAMPPVKSSKPSVVAPPESAS